MTQEGKDIQACVLLPPNFSFYHDNWLSSPLSQVKIARRWELWGGGSRPRYSLLTHPMDGWTTRDLMEFFIVVFFNIIPVIS